MQTQHQEINFQTLGIGQSWVLPAPEATRGQSCRGPGRTRPRALPADSAGLAAAILAGDCSDEATNLSRQSNCQDEGTSPSCQSLRRRGHTRPRAAAAISAAVDATQGQTSPVDDHPNITPNIKTSIYDEAQGCCWQLWLIPCGVKADVFDNVVTLSSPCLAATVGHTIANTTSTKTITKHGEPVPLGTCLLA